MEKKIWVECGRSVKQGSILKFEGTEDNRKNPVKIVGVRTEIRNRNFLKQVGSSSHSLSTSRTDKQVKHMFISCYRTAESKHNAREKLTGECFENMK